MAPDLNSLPASGTTDSTATTLRSHRSSNDAPEQPLTTTSSHQPTTMPSVLAHRPRHSFSQQSSQLEQRRTALTSDHTIHSHTDIQSSSESSRSRRTSLGELHQQLENEQEAQVNRLLRMIRQQQDQMDDLRREQIQTSEILSADTMFANPSVLPSPQPFPSEHISSHGGNTLNDQDRTLSQTSSSRHSTGECNGTSHSSASRPTSGTLGLLSETSPPERTRDQASFYQAEIQNLMRENQMLRMRMRELERQISVANEPSDDRTNSTSPTEQSWQME